MNLKNKEKKIKSTIEEIIGIKLNHQDFYKGDDEKYIESKIIIKDAKGKELTKVQNLEDFENIDIDKVLCYSENALGNGVISGIKDIVYIKSESFDMSNSNRVVSQIREMNAKSDEKAFFVGEYGRRISKNLIYDAVVKWSTRYGLHNPTSDKLEDHFSPHNLRHCFTTYLRRNGMEREYRKELRGDKRAEVMDLYDHIEEKELRREYLAAIPKFDVY